MKIKLSPALQSLRKSFFSSLALGTLLAFTASAQQPAPTPVDKNRPHFTVDQNGWSANGSLVLNVHLLAAANSPLKLYTGDINAPASASDTSSKFQLFSMATSYLVDTYTGKRIGALPQLPPSPFYGPLSVAGLIGSGSGVHLGVAFPAPPTPPLSRDGQPQPYKLILYVPIDAPPVLVTIPPKS